MSVEFNNSTVTIKMAENSLYINNKKAYTADIYDGTFKGYSVYANKDSKYAIIEANTASVCGDDSGYIVGALNTQEEIIKVEQKFGEDYVDLPACSLSLYYKDDKIYGIKKGVDSNNKEFLYNLELVLK